MAASVSQAETVSALISTSNQKSAEAIFDKGREAVVFTLLTIVQELAEKNQADNQATPPRMKPV